MFYSIILDIILEDDVEWNHSDIAYENLRNILTKKWDVILFGGSWSNFDTNTYKLLNSLGTSSYFVNSEYFETLLHNFKEGCELLKDGYNYDFTIDRYWQSLIDRDNWFLVVPNIFFQGEGFSCIDNKAVNHTEVFITNNNVIELPVVKVLWNENDANEMFHNLQKNKWYKVDSNLFIKGTRRNFLTVVCGCRNKKILKEGMYFIIRDGPHKRTNAL